MSGRGTACLSASLCVILCLLGGLPGCVLPSGRPGPLTFSPDGRRLAFLWDEGLQVMWPDSPRWTSNKHVCWTEVARPNRLRSVWISSSAGNPANCSMGDWTLRFSPDSRYFAVAVPPAYELLIVDPVSGAFQRLTGPSQTVSSFAWFSDDEIAYVTHRPISREDHERGFWRRKVGREPGSPVCILLEKAVRTHGGRPLLGQTLERWSPTGRHVLYVSPPWGGRLMLLDAVLGTTRAIGPDGVHLEEVAWHPLGNRAFCVLDTTGRIGNLYAALVDAATGDSRDLTSAFRRSFPGENPPSQAVWTTDGEYILAHYSGQGGILIRPDPWRVIPLAVRVVSRLASLSEPEQTAVQRERIPALFWLPRPGWVGIWATWGGMLYATDYRGERVIPLLADRGRWAFSRDGMLAATVDGAKRVTLHALGPWPALATEPENGIAPSNLREEDVDELKH